MRNRARHHPKHAMRALLTSPFVARLGSRYHGAGLLRLYALINLGALAIVFPIPGNDRAARSSFG
jgi:hypothetical protein